MVITNLNEPFSTFEHKADIGVQGVGKTIEEAFENAAIAMFSIVVEELPSIHPQSEVTLHTESFDVEGLLVSWLNTLLAQADLRRMLFVSFKVKITETKLVGTAIGELFDETRHERGIEVKGATFSEVFVGKKNGKWVARCVVDV